MEVGHGAHAAVPPHAEDDARDDARHLFKSKPIGHRAAHQVDAGGDAGMDVGVDRVGEGRQEDARPARDRLVVVVDDLRIPLVVEHLRDGLRLGHVVHEPVAVVIVADVVVIEPRRARRLEGGVEGVLVPRGDDVEAVRVHHRHEQQDGVVADVLHLGRLFGRHAVGQQGRHLRVRHFARVQPPIDPGDRLALAREPAGRRLVDAGAGQLLAGATPMLQPFQVLFARNKQQQHRPPQHRRADLAHLDPVAGCVELLIIVEHLAVGRQLIIVARREAEDVGGVRHLRRGRAGHEEDQQQAGAGVAGKTGHRSGGHRGLF